MARRCEPREGCKSECSYVRDCPCTYCWELQQRSPGSVDVSLAGLSAETMLSETEERDALFGQFVFRTRKQLGRALEPGNYASRRNT